MNLDHWKTTAAAAVTAFFGFVLYSPETFAALPILKAIAGYAAIGGLVTFGIVAGDKPADKETK